MNQKTLKRKKERLGISQLKKSRIFLILIGIGLIGGSFVYAVEFPKVVEVKGEVECKRNNDQWKDVSVGDIFEKGDRIKTFSNSRCDLHMDKAGEQAVGIFSNSEVIVLMDKKEKFELVNATVLFSLEGLPEGSTFEVKTPTAVCGVMGTGFKIFSDTTMTQINAYYNSVYGRNFDGEKKDVPPGFFRKIGKDGKISKLFKCPQMDLKRFRSWKKNAGTQANNGSQGPGAKDKRSRNFRFEKPGIGSGGVRDKMDKRNSQQKDKKNLETSTGCGSGEIITGGGEEMVREQ